MSHLPHGIATASSLFLEASANECEFTQVQCQSRHPEHLGGTQLKYHNQEDTVTAFNRALHTTNGLLIERP